MSISNSIFRLKDFYRRHGFVATMMRAGLAVKRAFFAKRMAVFFCDLNERKLHHPKLPGNVKVDRLRALAELSAEHLQAITDFWTPKLANRNIRERFEKGASLWLVECDEQLAGFGWTLQGSTIGSYYFPLAQNDVHLFDFHVFPRFRGRGINPYLISQILDSLASSCGGRAFIEAAEWNDAQLHSLRKTPFRCLGLARSYAIFGHTFVSWTKGSRVAQLRENADPKHQALRMAISNEE